MVHRRQALCSPPKNREFCVIPAEEMIAYSLVEPKDKDGVANISYDIKRIRQDRHCPCLDMSEMKQQKNVK